MMKKTLTAIASLALIATAQLRAVDLINLGSDGFSIDGGSVGTYSQSATSLTFTAFSLTDSVYGYTVVSPVDISGEPGFGIRMTLTGTNPDLPYDLYLYDSTYSGGATGFSHYKATTTGLATGSEVTNNLSLFASGADLSSIVGLGFSFGADVASANVNMGGIVSVPEPSTYALLAMSALGLGGYVVRRRRR